MTAIRPILFAVPLFLLAPMARAADADSITAETLFQEGKRLMGESRLHEACEKFAESQRLDPAGGTLLNLAMCHEQEGKTATAWYEFKEVLRVSRSQREDRAQIAQQHIDAIEPNLARLTIRVPSDVRVPNLKISLNNAARNEASWGSAIPTDPGPQTIVARAEGFQPYSVSVQLKANQKLVVDIPKLNPDMSNGVDHPPPPPPPNETKPNLQWIGWTGIAVGAAALGVAGYFGIQAMNASSDADKICPTTSCSKEDGIQLNQDALDNARLANIIGAAGLVTAGAGVAFLIFAPSGKSTTQGRPTIVPAQNGVSVGWNQRF